MTSATYPYYEICLPLPTSINNAHTLTEGKFNHKTRKYERAKVRSSDYNEWVEAARVQWCLQFPQGVDVMLPMNFKNRLRVDYIFIWNFQDRGVESSDIGNREKCLSDFLEKKFYENDRLIDEQHQYRRISVKFSNRVLLRVYEIPDRRYDDPLLIFNPQTKGA